MQYKAERPFIQKYSNFEYWIFYSQFNAIIRGSFMVRSLRANLLAAGRPLGGINDSRIRNIFIGANSNVNIVSM